MPQRPISPKSDTAASKKGKKRGAVPAAYTQLHQQFGWVVPEYFNMAQVCSARWALDAKAKHRVAVRTYDPNGKGQTHTYAQLQTQADTLSHVLKAQGVLQGDRVAIVMPQCFETAVAYIAVLQMGAVAMPLSMLFGPEALVFRLQDSDAKVALCHATALSSIQAAQKECPLLQSVLQVETAIASSQTQGTFKPVPTLAQDPAVLIYTSGTTFLTKR
ncbi:MAG: hypothetical protein RLZZ454_1345 [Pseudomonadota bacterium]